MSDTLQEGENQMDQHQVNRSGVCEIPGCPCRGWSAQETASVKEVNKLHTDDCVRQRAKFGARSLAGDVCSCGAEQPAARGGGDGPVRIWLQPGQALDPAECTLSHVGTERVTDSDIEYIHMDQHQALVAERERLRGVLRQVRNAYNEGPSAEKVRAAMDAVIDYVDEALSEQRSTSE